MFSQETLVILDRFGCSCNPEGKCFNLPLGHMLMTVEKVIRTHPVSDEVHAELIDLFRQACNRVRS